MIEATLALSRSLGSIDSTVDSTTEFNNDSIQHGRFNNDSTTDSTVDSTMIQLKLRKSTVQRVIPWGVHWESMGSSRVRQGFREK